MSILNLQNMKMFKLLVLAVLLITACGSPMVTKHQPESPKETEAADDEVVTEELLDNVENEKELMMDLTVVNLEKTVDVVLEEQKMSEQNTGVKKEKNSKNSPPVQAFKVRFAIQNKNPEAVWYIMPYNGASRLPENGQFNLNNSLTVEKALLAKKYPGQQAGSELIELLFTGMPNQHFRAFYIPGNSSFSLNNYSIDCWQEADKIELWAVRTLKVNNKIKLDDWLPNSVQSSPGVMVSCAKEGCNSGDVEFDRPLNQHAVALQFIQAQKVTKYKVQLKG